MVDVYSDPAWDRAIAERDAEITRLTELVAWHEADKARFNDVQSAHLREITRLKKEVERLRAALERLSNELRQFGYEESTLAALKEEKADG